VTESVVVHYRDGQLLKGQTTGFSGENLRFEVQQLHGGPQPISVELANLKAVFFVKDFVGQTRRTPRSKPSPAIPMSPVHGWKSALRRRRFVGTVEGYRPNGLGFFLVPADPDSNNLRASSSRRL
jgi:hypothetical protein